MRFTFVGNRKFVLEAMIQAKLDISKVFVIEESRLSKDILYLPLADKKVFVKNKQELLSELEKTEFDILISNGCPFIFPPDLLNDGRKYINIHPSYLPDLRGIDPVVGAILYNRNAGATCHLMNDKIDEGDIIAQILIPYSPDLDVRLLYQLSFIAEKQVFLNALTLNFSVMKKQKIEKEIINYKRTISDMQITFFEPAQLIINKINAFNNRSQGAFFYYKNKRIRVFHGKILINPYLNTLTSHNQYREIINVFENCIIVKLIDGLILLDQIEGDLSLIRIGDRLGEV